MCKNDVYHMLCLCVCVCVNVSVDVTCATVLPA